MPANEFEKQVQQKMEELQLVPSASVWEKVEEQIREKKRRRIIFFFILPLALGLLGFSFYQFLYTPGKKQPLQQADAIQKQDPLTKDPQPSIETKIEPATDQPQDLHTAQPLKNDIAQKQEPNTNADKIADISITNHRVSTIKNSTTIRASDKTNDKPAASQQQQDILPLTSPDINAKTNISAKQQPNNVIDKAAPTTVIKDAKNPEPAKTIQPANLKTEAKDTGTVKTDSLNKKDFAAADKKEDVIAKKKTGNSKMKWGIDLSIGMTSSHQGIFSLEKTYAADLTSSPITGSPGGSPAIIPPSLISSGPAFKIGIAGAWQLSARSRITTGLQYAYASNHIETGARMDTTIRLQSQSSFADMQVNTVYRGSPQSTYTNKYHFISIPVGYHWQMNRGKKMQVQWDAGASVSYLVATNALVYDRALGGIYYHDKKAFTKMHFDMGTGFSFRFLQKNGNEWEIGPEVSFDMSSLQKNDNKQYLLYGGIHSRLLFSKKKNK
jgi:hypothetical protein